MIGTRSEHWHRWVGRAYTFSALLTAGACFTACGGDDRPRTFQPPSATLRVGVGQMSATSGTSGLRQLTQNQSVEGLGRLGDDGRVEPWLAENWTLTNGGRSLIVTIKSGAKFHDGSPADPKNIVAILPDPMRGTLGPLFEDVEEIRVADEKSIEIRFRRRSPLLLESLEVQIKKPGQTIIATGPFMVTPNSTTELRANENYYLGRPRVDEIRLQTFPSVRTAWAELLRNRIDMLYEVGTDALDSLQSATNVSVFTFVRHYQYSLVLNIEFPALRSDAIRRALNAAVDRKELVRQALSDHGVISSGPIWPKYWALAKDAPTAEYDPASAADILGPKRLRFTCLVPPDSVYERIALELKRQFAAVGVDMNVQATPQDDIYDAENKRKFEAILIETVSAPTLLRPFQLWHSKGAVNPSGNFGTRTTDAAFNKVRYAETEADYREAVGQLQQAFLDDPPAIFLAWSERARAISKRFDVPLPEPGRDILSTLRLWTPRNDQKLASRN